MKAIILIIFSAICMSAVNDVEKHTFWVAIADIETTEKDGSLMNWNVVEVIDAKNSDIAQQLFKNFIKKDNDLKRGSIRNKVFYLRLIRPEDILK